MRGIAQRLAKLEAGQGPKDIPDQIVVRLVSPDQTTRIHSVSVLVGNRYERITRGKEEAEPDFLARMVGERETLKKTTQS